MYCTTEATFYCNGKADETIPKFQAMFADLAVLLRDKYPDIWVNDLEAPLTADEVHEGYDSKKDFEGVDSDQAAQGG